MCLTVIAMCPTFVAMCLTVVAVCLTVVAMCPTVVAMCLTVIAMCLTVVAMCSVPARHTPLETLQRQAGHVNNVSRGMDAMSINSSKSHSYVFIHCL